MSIFKKGGGLILPDPDAWFVNDVVLCTFNFSAFIEFCIVLTCVILSETSFVKLSKYLDYAKKIRIYLKTNECCLLQVMTLK